MFNTERMKQMVVSGLESKLSGHTSKITLPSAMQSARIFTPNSAPQSYSRTNGTPTRGEWHYITNNKISDQLLFRLPKPGRLPDRLKIEGNSRGLVVGKHDVAQRVRVSNTRKINDGDRKGIQSHFAPRHEQSLPVDQGANTMIPNRD